MASTTGLDRFLRLENRQEDPRTAGDSPSEPAQAVYSAIHRLLIVVCAGGHILMIDPTTAEIQKQWHYGGEGRKWPGSQPCEWLLLSPDEDKLVTLACGSEVDVWEMPTGKRLYQVRHDKIVKDIDFSSDGKLLLSSSEDKIAQVWDAERGQDRTSIVPSRLGFLCMLFRECYAGT